MKRPARLVAISRRDFCSLAGCAAGVALAGCTVGPDGVVQTGPLGASPDARPGGPDAGGRDAGAVDGRMSVDARPTPDAPNADACTGSAQDVGAPSSFAMSTPVKFSTGRFFVVRDAGGLYAVSSACTHEGVITNVVQGVFLCPRHGAQFTFAGDIISGPVSTPLVHYAMCLLPNGHAGVDTSTIASKSARLAV